MWFCFRCRVFNAAAHLLSVLVSRFLEADCREERVLVNVAWFRCALRILIIAELSFLGEQDMSVLCVTINSAVNKYVYYCIVYYNVKLRCSEYDICEVS